eukprot:321946_1
MFATAFLTSTENYTLSMAAQKVYSDDEIDKMTGTALRRILREDYNKTDDDLKLGRFLKPYKDMIRDEQNVAVSHSKSKFVAGKTNLEFERQKQKMTASKDEDKKTDKKPTRNRFFRNDDDNVDGGSDRFDEHDTSLEPVDELQAFAANVNDHYGTSILSDEYLQRLKDEDTDLGGLQALLIDYRERGVLLLTNKNGDYRMKGGHVSKMYDFLVSSQPDGGKNNNKNCANVGGVGTNNSNNKNNDVGDDVEAPCLGDKDTAPDYIGMIGYIYNKKLMDLDISHLIKKASFKTRGIYWLRCCSMVRDHKSLKKKDPKKNVSVPKLSGGMSSGSLGNLKWISICILNSPTKMEQIFQENSQAITSKACMDAIRNYLGDVYLDNKDDLAGVEYAFNATFVDDFQRMWGGDMWGAVKDWCDVSPEYLSYTKKKK